jgi:hypothetical protein
MTMKGRRSLLLLALSVAANSVALADVSVGPTNVTKYYAYNDYGGGDVIFWVSATTMPAGCGSGFWLPPSAAGFKVIISALQTAYVTQLPVWVYADPTMLWPGSTGQFCRVTTLNPS